MEIKIDCLWYINLCMFAYDTQTQYLAFSVLEVISLACPFIVKGNLNKVSE